jgi:hypothetical protein
MDFLRYVAGVLPSAGNPPAVDHEFGPELQLALRKILHDLRASCLPEPARLQEYESLCATLRSKTFRHAYSSDAEVMDRVYCALNEKVETQLRRIDYTEQNYSSWFDYEGFFQQRDQRLFPKGHGASSSYARSSSASTSSSSSWTSN